MPTIPKRPARATAVDELGRVQSLPAGPGDFRPLCGSGPKLVLLGLGPEPEALPGLFPTCNTVHYLESPSLTEHLGPEWRARIPATFREIAPSELPALARSGSKLLFYAPGQRLHPSFWSPLLARVQLAILEQAPKPQPRLAWLPGGPSALLRLELREALETLGYQVRTSTDAGGELDTAAQRSLLAGGECPALLLSINFCGLDPLGEAYHLLRAAGAQVAVWCVDNPLHLLSGLKSPFWRAVPLFVTDAWFVEPLRRLGACSVSHLPLAARASALATPPLPGDPDLANSLLFVGRSAFPEKGGFFAGCRLPQDIWGQAQAMLALGERPDFGWWLPRLGITQLWPGAAVRQAGFGAEETGQAWRTLCLTHAQAALGSQLTVYGDDGWNSLLPTGTDLRPPVDYYIALPGLVGSAACCLNLTSPLLPHGLTQRHFDTWAWGGMLLSDATPGLDIFPAELTREMTFRAPEHLAERFRALTGQRSLRRDLCSAWRDLLRREHTYVHRLERLLETVGAGSC